MADAKRDGNFVTTLLGVSNADQKTPVVIWADPTTHRLLVDLSGGIAGILQTDIFTSTNLQVAFTASQTVAYTFFFSVNGAVQTPNSDYTVAGNILTLASGIPSGCACVWVYSTS